MLTSPTPDDESSHDTNTTVHPGPPPEPGLVLIFSDGRPALDVIPLDHGSIQLARGDVGGVIIRDKRMSKPHARITFDAGIWTVEDLASRNGTTADGQEVPSSGTIVAHTFVRTGHSLFLLAADVRPYRAGMTRSGDVEREATEAEFVAFVQPTVAVPPLRERLEEMPWLIARVSKEVKRSSQELDIHVSFVEACLLRPWPGNVREFVAEVKHAAISAAEDGGILFARHLHEGAGSQYPSTTPP